MEKKSIQLLSRSFHAALGGSGTGTARTGLLPFSRHVSDGDEPPFKTFENILEKAKADLKELMHIPDNYKILFLQGGGSTQFAMIPMNLMNKNNKADYVITGQWAKKAAAEAERYGKSEHRCFLSRLNLRPHPHTDPSNSTPKRIIFISH